MLIKFARNQPKSSPPKTPQKEALPETNHSCAHHGHGDSFSLTSEAVSEIPHALLELAGDFSIGGQNSAYGHGAVALLAGARSFKQFQKGSPQGKLEGVGSLALAAGSVFHAVEVMHDHGSEGHHHHSHGLGPIGVLETVHGLAHIAHGVVDLKEGGEDRKLAGYLAIAKGTSAIAAVMVPSIAMPMHLVHFASAVGGAILDPGH